ncbi:hypothetical protein ACFXHA_24690 [Nocardia sp. NPDC059240]|uniref:hypothetical protein n=1 Tax=Nocardia sp. NPDC059240 TaxID=3346786 RepID=UPI00369ADB30
MTSAIDRDGPDIPRGFGPARHDPVTKCGLSCGPQVFEKGLTMDPTGKSDQPVDDPETEKQWYDSYNQKGDQAHQDPPWKSGN